MTATSLVLAAAVAGILALDGVQMFQWMLARPVVSGSLVGAILGDLPTGMLCGAWTELVWLGVLPIGNYTPPDAHVTAVTAVAVAAAWGGGVPAAVVAVLLCVPVGILSRRFDHMLRGELATRAEALVKAGPPFRIERLYPLGLLPIVAKAALAVLLTGTAALALAPFARTLLAVERIERGVLFSATLLPALGMVQLARCIGAKGRERWIALGIVLCGLGLLVVHAL